MTATRHSGGYTTIPRWPTGLVGTAEQTFQLSPDLTIRMAELAERLDVDADAVLLAAHAVIIGVLSGEQRVTVAYGSPVSPVEVELTNLTWREVIHAAIESRRRTQSPFVYPAEKSLGCHTAVSHGPLVDKEVLFHIGFHRSPGSRQLVMRWRQEAMDAEYAARIADYHRTALSLASTNPDAKHEQGCLLGEAELRTQLGELQKPDRELPDQRVHELIAGVAMAQPDTVAVRFGDEQLTYRELDERANQVAHELLDAGLLAEDVVGVIAERNLYWIVGTLAVLKAGGCYLPVEPHFPIERIAGMFTRSGCRFLLIDKAGCPAFDGLANTVPNARAFNIDTLLDQPGDTSDPAVSVLADQLAYIYFTSGSTGQPKGVMCEHKGMLNHMLAKIDDLGLGQGTVVAQTAPQCFDISLWQLLAPLTVGGTVVIVSQQVLLNVGQFVTELGHRRVEVIQLVPSYLDVLLRHLDRLPMDLPALRCVSVTGEALKAALVRRWFDQMPDVALVNAYGLTETCDDTNHEIMDRRPDDSRVALGRPVPGAQVYVVDRNLMPLPLGATGEIVFAGWCLARGYIGDPVRTAAAFVPSPFAPGRRLYRSGDFGRWLPDRRLEFAGRRDNQVKIRGFRVEIEEIANELLRVPEVHEAAVIVVGGHGQERRLVGCYSGSPANPVESLVSVLSKALPDYMVPTDWYWLDVLPHTGSGKIDRGALATLTGEADRIVQISEQPATTAERRLAAAWATVLCKPEERIGRKDDFFESGGSSLSAVRLVTALDNTVSIGDVTRNPILSDLATLISDTAREGSICLCRLTPRTNSRRGTVIFFPYAGGNAASFLPLARQLGDAEWEVYGVDPPRMDGHDPAASASKVVELAERVVAELAELSLGPTLVWGHSLGVAPALETARQLRRGGFDICRVYLGAQLADSVSERQGQIADLEAFSDDEVLSQLVAESGRPELAEIALVNAASIVASYRYDIVAACRYLMEAERNQARLDVPITVVLADDDVGQAGDPYGWTRFGTDVRVHRLASGGHFFPMTHPAEVVRLITSEGQP